MTVKQRVTFSRSESWQDRRGKHSYCDVRVDKKEVGQVEGSQTDTFGGMSYIFRPSIYPWNAMKWDSHYTINEAKAEIRSKIELLLHELEENVK